MQECLNELHITWFRFIQSNIFNNPYKGCVHGCVYCYAPSVLHEEREWGTFVDVKINAPEILRQEVFRKEKGLTFLSSAVYPYQPVEANYKITQQILKFF